MWKWINPVKYPDKSGSPKKRFNWVKRTLVSIGILVGILLLFAYQPWIFLPHGYANMALPFAPEDDQYTGLIPMGEIEQWHNASTGLPDGHPGIDFQWNKETNILAVGEGRIARVYKNHEGKYNVEQFFNGYYRTVYQELNTVEPNIKFFAKVKKGQKIGTSGYHRVNFEGGAPKPTDPSPQIHWDFSSSSMADFRLCPLNHFDADSKKRIEAIWAKMKAKDSLSKSIPTSATELTKEWILVIRKR